MYEYSLACDDDRYGCRFMNMAIAKVILEQK